MISFAHVAGNLGVGVELHGVASATLGLRPQVADVAEHLGQRHDSRRRSDTGASSMAWICRGGVQVTDDVAHVCDRA